MASYWQLLLLILPVFALVAVGAVVRRVHWIEGPAETSLVRIVVNVCYPCLIFESVAGNAALREPGNLLLPPLLGFGITSLGIGLCFYAARALGMTAGHGLRTFALAAGICNYGYLPLPIMTAIWGQQSRGVLFVHNVGVEAAMWTVGMFVMNGLSLREGWKKLFTPILLTLFAAVLLNLAGAAPHVPQLVTDVVHALAVCAIPLGLITVGVSLANYLGEPSAFFQPKVTIASCALRLGVLPLVILGAARWLPCSLELKRVLVVQAAMPAAVFPIVIARHYGGQPLTAVQIVLGTTVLGVFVGPLWISAGRAWLGV
ncbi:MAG: AEC family transporter [Opitutaceae bacterium]